MSTQSGEKKPTSLTSDSLRVSYDEVKAAFLAGKKLGEGQFGTVYMGNLRGKRVAVKKLHHENVYEARLFAREMNNLAACRHENLLSLVAWAVDDATGDRYLVTEFVNGGSLARRLAPGEGPRMSLENRLDIARQVSNGLAVLHAASIVHRDLKVDNILVKEIGPTGQLQAKVADFGLSRLSPELTSGRQAYSFVVGTPGYIDPVYQMTGTVDPRSDIYSLGVLFLEMIMGKPITASKQNVVQVARAVLSGKQTVESFADAELLARAGRPCPEAKAAVMQWIRLACDCLHDLRTSRPTLDACHSRLTAMMEAVRGAETAPTDLEVSLAAYAAPIIARIPGRAELSHEAIVRLYPEVVTGAALEMLSAVPENPGALFHPGGVRAVTAEPASEDEARVLATLCKLKAKVASLAPGLRGELETSCRNSGHSIHSNFAVHSIAQQIGTAARRLLPLPRFTKLTVADL
jgi:serine/threonine protein kinase